ncbi:hypothetical protein ACFXTI_022344 [Malus domestica]
MRYFRTTSRCLRLRLCFRPRVGCRSSINGTRQQIRSLSERLRRGGDLQRVGLSVILMELGVKTGTGGGFGVVIRNHLGEFVAAVAGPIEGSCLALQAEFIVA